MFYFKQKAEGTHVLGSCGRSQEYWALKNKTLVSYLEFTTYLLSDLA